MVTRASVTAIFLCLTPTTLLAADDAQEVKETSTFDWSFVDLEYLDLDFENLSFTRDVGGNGYDLEGQYAFGKHILLYGGYRTVEAGFSETFSIMPVNGVGTVTTRSDIEREDIRIGVGGRFQLGESVGIFVRGGYLNVKETNQFSETAQVNGENFFFNFKNSLSDDGYFVTVGVRGKVHDRVELFVTANHEAGIDFGFPVDDSETDYQLGARFGLSRRFELGLAYRAGKDFDGYGLSGRYTF